METTIKKTALAAAMLLVAGTAADAAVRYVAPNGTGDGTSWQQATADLQQAIDDAAAGDEIWVAAGTYKPTRLIKSTMQTSKAFIIKDGVSLYGGFAGTETARDERSTGANAYDMTNATILSADDDTPDKWTRKIADATTYRWEWELESDQIPGTQNNSPHVIYAADRLTQPTVVDGFTLTGANANVWKVKAAGGAVYALGTIDLRNCRIVENSAYFTAEGSVDSNTYGAAVYIDGGKMTDCYVARTYGHSSYGNGIGSVYSVNSTISGCTFEDCVALDAGGAVYLKGGSLADCTFARCYGSMGGAVYNDGGSVSGISVLDCRGLRGGGVYQASGKLLDAVVLGCYADAPEFADGGTMGGGAVYVLAGDAAGIVACNNSSYAGGGVMLKGGRLINATVLNNTNRDGADNVAAEGAQVLNSITDAATELNNFVAPTSFAGCAKGDDASQLAAIAAADWRLAAGSAFIDAGEAVSGYADGTDVAGNPRVVGASIDLGAYEAQGGEKTPTVVLTFAPGTEAAKIGTGGATGYEFSIDWGDGVEQTYSGQAYYSNLLKGNTVKIYGDEILLVYANAQGIVSADISRAASIQAVQFTGNEMTSLTLGQHPDLTGLYAAGNKLTSIDLSGAPALRVIDLHENAIEGSIDCSAMNALSKIDVADNRLSTLVLPKHATVYDVDCANNGLTALDVAGLSGLTSLSCAGNKLTTLDLSGLTALEDLYAGENAFTIIDASPCSSLQTLMLAENNISSIDLSKNKTLRGVYLQDNKLDALDVSALSDLRWLNIQNNNVAELDVTNQPSLSILIASGNRLSAIDLSRNSSLSSLDLASNALSALDLSAIPYLSQLHFENNTITSIDLSRNTYLYGLFCANNGLTELNINANTYLQRLEAQGNALTALDLTKNKGLNQVYVQSNRLDDAALAALIAALPDVSGVEVTESSADFVRKLNISYMPGTAAADVVAAEAKGWFVTAETDAPAATELTDLGLQLNNATGAFMETWSVAVAYANDTKTSLRIENFNGTGANLTASIDAEGNVKVFPQVCGYDADYNMCMIVNADNTTGNPMEISSTYVAGTWDGTTLTLEPWNLIKVPYTFDSNLGTVYADNISSTFVKPNGTMDYTTVGGTERTVAIYSTVSGDDSDTVLVYGWGDCGLATLSRVDNKWTVDAAATALVLNGNDYAITASGEALKAVSQADARTLTFGAWQLESAAGNLRLMDCTSAVLHLGIDLPLGTSGIDSAIADGAEIVSTVWYNAAGIASPEAFTGLNIRVDTLSDGTVRTSKVYVR